MPPLVTGCSRSVRTWTGPLLIVRWIVPAALVAVPFALLGRRLSTGLGPRVYRYAAVP